MMKRVLPVAFALLLFSSPLFAQTSSFSIPAETQQLIVGRTDGWNTFRVHLQCWEREPEGKWKKSGKRWAGSIGKNGLAWGLGLHPEMRGAYKKEGDRRAPAGVFELGKIYGYAESVRKHPQWPYHRVTQSDLWVDDVHSQYYNRHVRLDGGRGPQNEWERKAQMRLNDEAHSLKLFIKHNYGKNIVPGGGSAIFFHVWRAKDRATFGCTTMPKPTLASVISWMDPDKQPLYVLLPNKEYKQLRKEWMLP